MKANDPVSSYQEILSKIRIDKDSKPIDELPAEQQAWLRSTS